jgi:hypothetical protein
MIALEDLYADVAAARLAVAQADLVAQIITWSGRLPERCQAIAPKLSRRRFSPIAAQFTKLGGHKISGRVDARVDADEEVRRSGKLAS